MRINAIDQAGRMGLVAATVVFTSGVLAVRMLFRRRRKLRTAVKRGDDLKK